MRKLTAFQHGFTLIELSIVLVIIGLIIGGVLVGQDLISAAATRATVAQVEKFNSAANTFVTKYGYLPGDIPAAAVTTFGFSVVPDSQRAGTRGLGNGDGLIDSWNGSGWFPCAHVGGENEWFWEDLSGNSNLIQGTFNTTTGAATSPGSSVYATGIPNYLPAAKLGGGNYFSVCEQNGQNYFILSKSVQITRNTNDYCSTPQMSVMQAYYIDKKIDDGLPQTGQVIAQFQNNPSTCTDGYPTNDAAMLWVGASDTSATPGTSSTCYDNGGNGGQQQYSTEISNGSNPNCALSFKMQGAGR